MRLFPNRTESAPDQAGSWVVWRWLKIKKVIRRDALTKVTLGVAGREASDVYEVSYLTRLTLLRTPWFQVMLHWIHRPDLDGALHDHPWRFLSIILRGWYEEMVGEPTLDKLGLLNLRTRVVSIFNYKSKRTAHEVTRVSKRGVLSLVITGPVEKSWGFYEISRPPVHVFPGTHRWCDYYPWREFLARQQATPDPDRSPTTGK